MTRPGAAEWSVLDLDRDPVPGDPESFDEIVRAYQELASSTREAHSLLVSGGRIDAGLGKAMEAFKDLIGKLPGRLDQMAESYSRAADAYLRYLPSLEEAQAMSLRALEEARQGAQDQGAALAAVNAAVAALNPDADAAARQAAEDGAAAARARQDQARQAVDQAKALLGQATALRDQAANTAAKVLRELGDDAPQRSLWEKIAEAFRAFIDFLRSTVVQWITLALDVLSTIAFAIFPPLGQAIGLLSGGLELAAAALGGDAGEIAMAAGGIALGLVPGGRLAKNVLKFAGKGGTVKNGIKAGVKDIGERAPGTGDSVASRASRPNGRTVKGSFNNLRNSAVRTVGRGWSKVDPSTVVGVTNNGKATLVRGKEIRSHPIVDSEGRPIGVGFPTRPKDMAEDIKWGKATENRFFGRHNSPGGGTDYTQGTYRHEAAPNSWRAPDSTTPWAPGEIPKVVSAHANPQTIAVSLKNGKQVQLGGKEFATVLHHNDTFRQATAANPQGPLAMLSCSFGGPGGRAAPDFAKAMQDLGHSQRVYGATDDVNLWSTTAFTPYPDGTPRTVAEISVVNNGSFRPLDADVPQLPPIDQTDVRLPRAHELMPFRRDGN